MAETEKLYTDAVPMALQPMCTNFTSADLHESAEWMLREAVERFRVSHEMDEEGISTLSPDAILLRMMRHDY